jgi:hypothetical protein
MQPFDRTKTLEQLEGVVWPHNAYPSRVVQESQRLRRVPVDRLTLEDLRFLLGQQIGSSFLVPVALAHLSDDPLASGDLFRGDLLSNLLALPDEFWAKHPELNNDVVELGIQVHGIYDTLAEVVLAFKRFKFVDSKPL